MHPVLRALLDAADGRFPPVDGVCEVVPSWRPDLSAVVSFTGHALVATGAPQRLRDVELDGFGRALHPGVLAAIAGYPAEIGVLDVVLVARGVEGGAALPPRDDLDDHPRVVHARAIRDDVRVFGDERALLTLGRGVAGRTELSVELLGDAPPGTGRDVVGRALRLVPAGEPVFAAVAPGNARSLRAFLAAGFVPIGSEVVIRHLG